MVVVVVVVVVVSVAVAVAVGGGSGSCGGDGGGVGSGGGGVACRRSPGLPPVMVPDPAHPAESGRTVPHPDGATVPIVEHHTVYPRDAQTDEADVHRLVRGTRRPGDDACGCFVTQQSLLSSSSLALGCLTVCVGMLTAGVFWECNLHDQCFDNCHCVFCQRMHNQWRPDVLI